MAFNKFDPHNESEVEEISESSKRRIAVLTWVRWIVLAYTGLGFALIAIWTFS